MSTPTVLMASATPTALLAPFVTGLFVGNTPLTVLFFLALAVGVVIACIFFFFTVRYFVRSRYGLHVFPASYRGTFSTSSDGQRWTHPPLDRELEEHIEYLRAHRFLREDFLERRIGRRRRRSRFARMKKLAPAEVDNLFPRRLYAEWLASGPEPDTVREGHAQRERGESSHSDSDSEDENGESSDSASPRSSSDTDVAREVDLGEARRLASVQGKADEVELTVTALRDGDPKQLHFDSGSCAICLDAFAGADTVRGLVCGHVFHADCVDPWLTKRRACCPICKRDYYKDTGESSEPLDYEALRLDPNVQALLNELVPLLERVRVILAEHPGLLLQEHGQRVAGKKFLALYKRVFWRLMGISKEDMFNWAVLRKFKSRSDAAAPNAPLQTSGSQPTATHTPVAGADGIDLADLAARRV